MEAEGITKTTLKTNLRTFVDAFQRVVVSEVAIIKAEKLYAGVLYRIREHYVM